MEKESLYTYFFIDLKDSRSFDDQKITNFLLNKLAAFLNTHLGEQLLTPFDVREGDALIGGGRGASLLLTAYEQCIAWFYSPELEKFIRESGLPKEKIQFYFGAGLGDITTPPEVLHNIEQINGSALRFAKEATEEAKFINQDIDNDTGKKSGNYAFLLQPFKFYAKTSEENQLGNVLTAMMYLTYEMLVHNTSQSHLFFIKTHYPDLANHEIAEMLGYEFDVADQKERYVMSSRISRLLSTSYYKLHLRSKEDLRSYLNNIEGENT